MKTSTYRLSKFWANLSLSRKLLVAFSVLAVLALVVGVVTNVGLNRVKNSYEHALSNGEEMERASLQLSNDLLTARRHEKDFLARWTTEGFDTAYANYVVTNQKALDEIQQQLTKLSGFSATVGQNLGTTYTQAQYESDLNVLQVNVNVYQQNFQKTVQLIQEKGFEDTGLEGQFRADVHAIEDRIYGRVDLDPLIITMLQIRRHEKDYLLRGDQTYIDQVHQSVTELKRQIAGSDVLNPSEKKQFTELANQYVISFDALVGKNVEITSSTQAFRDAAHTMEPVVDKLTNAGAQLSQIDVQQASSNSSRTFLYSSITLIVAVVITLILSITLSRQITLPVRLLTDAAHQLETGNFDVQAKVSSGDEIGALATTFNGMARQIKQTLGLIAQRATELQTVSDVSTAVSTVLNAEKLLWNVSNLTKERFGFYHAHIYLVNEADDMLILAAGAGEPGRQMVAEGRSIPLNREQSLVARAARERKGVIVNDVRSAPDFLSNPLLPDTRSELAVPMIVNEKVIGVFDVQSDVVDRFTQENVDIQTIMASQIAVAVQNARSYVQVQRQAEREALIASIGQKIQRASTMEETLKTVTRELGIALGLSRVRTSLGLNQQNKNGGV